MVAERHRLLIGRLYVTAGINVTSRCVAELALCYRPPGQPRFGGIVERALRSRMTASAKRYAVTTTR